ncbi:MAG: hypothetical protein CMI00_02650 [Oceanospirillaceae bacterium]|nr:hypothetical protein [Oceanospirillaceae bacterium]|tara:strand:- start:38317 stop:38958 length:642 start_codon:yes stop_codon:yes gene_type:complete
MRRWFLLCRQAVGEQDHLLDLFCAEQGLVRVRVSPPVLTPDLLCEYEGDWQAGKDWPKLRGVAEVRPYPASGDALICALYISELLQLLLPQGEPQTGIYVLYRQTLQALSDGEAADVWLRFFEINLLQHLGYGFSWSHTASGEPLHPEQAYRYETGQGLSPAAEGSSGAALLAVAGGQLSDPAALLAARQVLRQAFNDILPRPLVSRELLIRG